MTVAIEFYTVPEVCKLTGLEPKDITELRHERHFPTSIRYSGQVLIPLIDLQPYIDAVKVPELAEYSLSQRRRAVYRLGVIREYQGITRKYNKRINLGKARSRAAWACGHSLRTLYRWESQLQQYGLPGLVDGRRGKRKRKAKK